VKSITLPVGGGVGGDQRVGGQQQIAQQQGGPTQLQNTRKLRVQVTAPQHVLAQLCETSVIVDGRGE
jgi:hypothetical protein